MYFAAHHKPRLRQNSAIAIFGLFAMLVAHQGAADTSWEGGLTTVYQWADDSRADAELTASADLGATIKIGRGELFIHIEGSSTPKSRGASTFYPTANGDSRSVLTKDGDGGLQVSEFNYTIVSEDKSSITFGLINPSAWLDKGRIANDENNHFLNGSLVNNATIEFPDYTLGVVRRLAASAGRPELSFVLSGSDGIADLPDRSYQDLLDLNEEGRGVFLGVGAVWDSGPSEWRLGAWARTDDHSLPFSQNDGGKNYGVYAVYNWRSGRDAWNVRVGFANPDVSVAERFLSLAYQRKLAEGQLGIGAAHTRISDTFRSTEGSRAWDAELYYRLPIFSGNGHLTPHLQYVVVPGIEASDTVPSSTATIAGVRLHLFF